MKRGCLSNLLFAAIAFVIFGVSSYLSFNYFVRGRSVSTPNLVGKPVEDARALCSDLGLQLLVDDEHRRNSDKIAAGNVVWQSKSPGTTNLIKRGASIKVELSAGALVLRVPEMRGQTPRTALLRLGQQNLKLGNLAYIANLAQGIMAEEPPQGTVVGAETSVSLLVGVSPAPPQYVMPDLIDHSIAEVKAALDAKKLNVSTVKYETYPGIPDGVVIRQFPLRGAPVSARDAITVVVSRAEQGGIIEQPAAGPAQ
jgi:eukaryotic-like serine/threonine-protein kinase